MTRVLTLKLDDFGRAALERFARADNGSHPKVVRTASIYYLADRRAHRPAWFVPDHGVDPETNESLSVEVDERTWGALSKEAADQGVTMEALATHALMYFLADVDSGRVAGQLIDALDSSEK
jgi:hypothetical protein